MQFLAQYKSTRPMTPNSYRVPIEARDEEEAKKIAARKKRMGYRLIMLVKKGKGA